MNGYRLTPNANADVFEIWLYIARDSVEAADRVEAAIRSACALLADSPLIGHARKGLTDLSVRFWTVPRYPNYVIVYDPANSPLKIIRVLHGARNIRRLLRNG